MCGGNGVATAWSCGTRWSRDRGRWNRNPGWRSRVARTALFVVRGLRLCCVETLAGFRAGTAGKPSDLQFRSRPEGLPAAPALVLASTPLRTPECRVCAPLDFREWFRECGCVLARGACDATDAETRSRAASAAPRSGYNLAPSPARAGPCAGRGPGPTPKLEVRGLSRRAGPPTPIVVSRGRTIPRHEKPLRRNPTAAKLRWALPAGVLLESWYHFVRNDHHPWFLG